MAQRQQRLVSTLSFAVAAAVMLSACGHGSATVAGVEAPATPTTSTTQTSPLDAAVTPTLAADIRACAGVQAIIGHLTVDTVRWSPNLDPFNKTISARIRVLSKDLAKQERQAVTRPIQAAVHSNARTFADVAEAMAGKDKLKVSRAIAASRVSYRGLKSVCALK